MPSTGIVSDSIGPLIDVHALRDAVTYAKTAVRHRSRLQSIPSPIHQDSRIMSLAAACPSVARESNLKIAFL